MKNIITILVSFFLILIIYGCVNSSSDNIGNDYIDTYEEIVESAPYLNQRREELSRLPKNQFMDSLTTHGCKVLSRMNLDLFNDDIQTIVEGFSSEDSTSYIVLVEIFRPVSWMLNNHNNRSFSDSEYKELDALMNKKCPDLYFKYQNMEKNHVEVLMKLMKGYNK